MSRPLLLLVGVIYAGVAAQQAVKGNWPLALVFGCYGLSQAGFWFAL